MARFNPWLGTQVGSVGDLVSYRRNGKQVQRVRVRNIANPRTEAQAKNRAVLATMGAAYSYMQGIVDHSFQNKNSKSENMQEFQKLNQGIARALDNAPAFDAQQYNYNFKGESVLRPNPYAIARGTLPSVQIVAPGEGSLFSGFTFSQRVGSVLFGANAAQLTYQQVANLFGVELGSQLTFCIISDDNWTGTPSSDNMPASYGNFHYARIILAPDDMDGSKLFWTINNTTYTINNANSNNRGSVVFEDGSIVVAGKQYPLAAGAILSNYNGRWLRSNCDMVVAADYVYSNGMAEVFNSYMDTNEEQPASPLYLNQSKAPRTQQQASLNEIVAVLGGEGQSLSPVDGVYHLPTDSTTVNVIVSGPLGEVSLPTGLGISGITVDEQTLNWNVGLTYTSSLTTGTASFGDVTCQFTRG